MKEKTKIIYKRSFDRDIYVLRPNTLYWRTRYWINQYGAMITLWLIRPVIKWNYTFWRIQEGEITEAGYDLHRVGMKVIEVPSIYGLHFPWWIRNNRSRLKKAFNWLKNV